MLPFLIVSLFTLFCIHYFLYYSVKRFFYISEFKNRAVLFLILVFLSLTYIASSALVRSYENWFTKIYYFISGYWVGLLINLLMALILIWLIFGVSKIIKYKFNIKIISATLFMVAFLYSVYGVWNAFNPIIKRIDVEIKNLPNNWKNKTIVHLTDIHLGVVHKQGFLNKIVSMVNELDSDIVAITGDLFDGMDGDLTVFTEGLSSIKSKKGVYYVTGNHEYYLGNTEAVNILEKANIKMLDNESVSLEGLQIVGASYPPPGTSKNVANKILKQENYFKDMPTVLLYHTPTSIGEKNKGENNTQSKTYWYPDLNNNPAKELGINLQLSGHTHKGQIFPFNFITKKIYQGRDHGLYNDGDFSIYVSNGAGTWGPAMRTGNRSEIVLITLK